MHGLFEKKKEKHLEEEKKPPVQQPLISMTEGPMELKKENEQHERERVLQPSTRFDVQLLDESRPIQEMARKNYEKSVKLEIAALKKELEKKRAKKKAPLKKKLDYGWKQDDEPLPPDDNDDKDKGKKE
ncbi:Uncharacterised protein [uncultured archaeon]|nr:Uncharacterised protein [uncultured archaeon]